MGQSSAFKRICKAAFIPLLCCLYCCSEQKGREVVLFESYCASCHVAPAIGDLPKYIWKDSILPEMGARMGIREDGYDSYKGVNFTEYDAIIKTGIYPSNPTIDLKDWAQLKKYIIALAPDSLIPNQNAQVPKNLTQFKPKTISVDKKEGSLFTYLNFNELNQSIVLGDISGNLLEYELENDTIKAIGRFRTPLVDYYGGIDGSFATVIGSLAPTAIRSGAVLKFKDGKVTVIADGLLRPTHTLVQDLNNDGTLEYVVSEFGDLTGQLTLLVQNANATYDKKVLLNQAGTNRVIAKDMDKDGKLDLIVCTSQGDEGITILYQQSDLSFRAEKVIRFSPVYGTNWFELIDYDGDGDEDIVTVNGDNADKSYIQKPYHGVRLHINRGDNSFEEKFFYPINGATRILAEDFDNDGDIDFAVLSTFPDYMHRPEQAFVYLENIDANTFTYTPYTFEKVNLGRWFLIDSGDFDKDGDQDIVLSAFSFGFTPVPEGLSAFWKEQMVDLVILENQLNTPAAE